MEKCSIIFLLTILFSVAYGESQTCRSVTTTTCDDKSFFPSSPDNAVKRGKMGAKGEKGERGPTGPDQNGFVLKFSEATAKHDEEINELQTSKLAHSSLLSELSELYLTQNTALLMQNKTIKSWINMLEKQNNKINNLMMSVNELNSCETPNVKLATKNSTSIVAHKTTVKYSCKMYYEPEGEPIRKCLNGKFKPSFHSNPLTCTRKRLTWKAAKKYCEEYDLFMVMTGTETTDKRKELCSRNSLSGWVWIGINKETGHWKLSDGSSLPDTFQYNWRAGGTDHTRGSDYMAVYCGKYSNYGKLYNMPSGNVFPFICQY